MAGNKRAGKLVGCYVDETTFALIKTRASKSKNVSVWLRDVLEAELKGAPDGQLYASLEIPASGAKMEVSNENIETGNELATAFDLSGDLPIISSDPSHADLSITEPNEQSGAD